MGSGDDWKRVEVLTMIDEESDKMSLCHDARESEHVNMYFSGF